jgi:beta-galactosidase
VTYAPGTLEARSYVNGELVSTDTLSTAGSAVKLVLHPEKTELSADGHSLSYVSVTVIDANGLVVPDAAVKLHATVNGSGSLDAFGSSNPITDENYTTGDFTTYQGRAMAIVRSGYDAGNCTVTVSAEGFETVTAVIDVK